MKISLAILVIFGLSFGVEGKRPGGRGGKDRKGPKGNIEKLCGELDLQCANGEWPKIFKGSACADINDGDEFPKFKDLTNPCEGGVDVSQYFISITDLSTPMWTPCKHKNSTLGWTGL